MRVLLGTQNMLSWYYSLYSQILHFTDILRIHEIHINPDINFITILIPFYFQILDRIVDAK